MHRSRCFYNAAHRSLRPELCNYVKTASTWIYSGTDLNAEQCREDVAAQQRVSGDLTVSQELIEKADLIENELSDALVALGIFPNSEILRAYRTERESQYRRCANRYVIYSELFFNKIDEFENFGSREDLDRMKDIAWEEHPYISQPGFTHCFLADGANQWHQRGVGAAADRSESGLQIPSQR